MITTDLLQSIVLLLLSIGMILTALVVLQLIIIIKNHFQNFLELCHIIKEILNIIDERKKKQK